MIKLRRVVEYVYRCEGCQEYVHAPKSLKVIGCADAAYATDANAKSNTRGIMGFESDRSCWIALISGKQSIVDSGYIYH